jgi:hypothetical protein
MTIANPLAHDEREPVAAHHGAAGCFPGPAPSAFCSDRSVKLTDTQRRHGTDGDWIRGTFSAWRRG